MVAGEFCPVLAGEVWPPPGVVEEFGTLAGA
jgi:hypothetical protein